MPAAFNQDSQIRFNSKQNQPIELRTGYWIRDILDHAEIKNELSIILDQQLREQGDPGGILDTKKAHKAAANLKPDFKSKPWAHTV